MSTHEFDHAAQRDLGANLAADAGSRRLESNGPPTSSNLTVLSHGPDSTVRQPYAQRTETSTADTSKSFDLRSTRVLDDSDPKVPPLLPGAFPSITGYDVLDVLGRGGMGVVYKARQRGLNRVVALKMILADGQTGSQTLARFRAEAEVLARLQHPNIVHIYEIGQEGGLAYFSLEYVEGGNLARRLAAGPLPARTAAELVETLARAIHAAHQAGIVHRDLKPSNVLLSSARIPKIADFGLAKNANGNGDQTHSEALFGTPSYMAPEQAAGRAKQTGPPADIHALGAILYEALTGRPVFRGATLLDTLEQVQFHQPVTPARLQPHLPRNLEAICLKCLEKDPRRRYASAEALAEDLRKFQAGEPVGARPANSIARAWLWCRRPNRIREAGVLAIFLAIFFFVYELLGFLGLALGRLPAARHGEAEWYLVGNILLVCAPMLFIGLGTVAKKLLAVWAGLLQSFVFVLASRAFGWQDVLGFEFDFGGMMPSFEARSPFFALTEVLAGIQFFAYLVALMAYYANRELMRRA